ncbi:MAG: flagellar biosynthetic protein FliR [Treponemataceae bacterium]|nr:flagellar biosynthetic protein FliR [Treponemataceae bacterium]
MLQTIVAAAPLFLLAAVRCFAMFQTSPLLSTNSVTRIAKLALSGACAYLLLPWLYQSGLSDAMTVGIDAGSVGSEGLFNGLATGGYQGVAVQPFSIQFVLLLIGEGLIGVLIGFYINLIFGVFSTAGQFFSFQMGFSAAQSYDALSQVENPLMGQYLNLMAMLIFLQTKGFQNLFLRGLTQSYTVLNAYSLVMARENILGFLLGGLTQLFLDAFLIAFPMIASLFLVSVTMGLLAKAAPQMNLFSESLPVSMIVSFLLLTLLLPIMVNYFSNVFESTFSNLESLLLQVKKAAG